MHDVEPAYFLCTNSAARTSQRWTWSRLLAFPSARRPLGCQVDSMLLDSIARAAGGARPMLPRATNPPRCSVEPTPNALRTMWLKTRSPLRMIAPYPCKCAAFSRFPSAAPALSHCSAAGTTPSFGETTNARSCGGFVACSLARARSSGDANGSRSTFSASNKSANAYRTSGPNSISRQGRRPPWSGARSAAASIERSSDAVGPGSTSRFGEIDRRPSKA